MKKVLIIQIRPEDAAADDELRTFKQFGGLKDDEVERVRAQQTDLSVIDPQNYSAIIVGGGPYNISDKNKSAEQGRVEESLKEIMQTICEHDIPYLGTCYGLGLLADTLGGEVSKEKYGEPVEASQITMTEAGEDDALCEGVISPFLAFGGHKESCQNLSPGAVLLASSAACPVHMIRYKQNVYGTQFHPELDVEGLITRIETYKYAGYFKPEEADDLITAAQKVTVTEPTKILKRFIDMYHRKA